MILRHVTKGDAILIAALLLLSLFGFFIAGHWGMGGKHVVVEVNGRRQLELPLGSDARESVKGPLGETVIVVEKGDVHIESSPCPNKHCVHMGSISRRGEILVCVPNRVVVSIKGGNGHDELDGVTQ